MPVELTLIIRDALILLGKIQYLKEFDSGKRQLLREFLKEYDLKIKPGLLKLGQDSDAEGIIRDIIDQYENFKGPQESIEWDEQSSNVSAGLSPYKIKAK